ncbi:MAG: diacylglycerol kinase family lipid kinase [Bdellovibrionales bacterium]|nr:diacylglycerol kinase family lipid kinase [Bdellovibrionales bacterium]
MKRIFLVNPAAGGVTPARIQKELKSLGEVRVCSSRKDLIRRTREAISRGFDQIVAVGGDGTVNAVANGFFPGGVDTPPARPALGVAPFGTGSDYFRTLAGSEEWTEILLHPKVVLADVGWISQDGGAGSCFLNLASVGASAEVVKRKESLPRWVPKKLRYVLPTIQQMAVVRPFPATIEVDDEKIPGNFLNVFVAKGTWAGGGMRFGAERPLADGLFHVTLVEAMSPAKALKNLPLLFLGRLEEAEGIRVMKARMVRVTSPVAVPIEADGETIGSGSVEFRLLPKKLRVCVSRSS